MLRNLTPNERAFIIEIAHRLEEKDSALLLADMNIARARPMLTDESIIRFELEGYVHPTRGGQEPYPVEGTMLDHDGSPISVLLFTDSADRLYELEFVYWGEGDTLHPDWTTLTFGPKPPEVWRPKS